MNILLKIFIYNTIFSFFIGLLKDIYIKLLKTRLSFDSTNEVNNTKDIELLEMTMKINKIVDYGFDEEII